MFEDVSDTAGEGILPIQRLIQAEYQGVIGSPQAIPRENYQPASLDLRLGETAYALQCSFLPNAGAVEDQLSQLTLGETDIRRGAILERGRPYLIPITERLRLPPDVHARANPKSSTGRLDIFTRVITDHAGRFDDVAPGYQGRMYLEVFSRSFTIRVETGLCLNQLRLFRGNPACENGQVLELHNSQHPALAAPELGAPEQRQRPAQPRWDNSLELSVDLSINLNVDLSPPADRSVRIGYRARKNSALLDLSRINHYRPEDFWEEVTAETDRPFILEPEELYLLSAAESVSIPPGLAAEMTAYETSSGELRTHYAGFFDPGFGYGPDGKLGGIQPVLEVRAHDVPFMIAPGQRVCTLTFERMMEQPSRWYGPGVGSSYHQPGRVLSKHFRQHQPNQQPRIPGISGDNRR